MSTWFVRQSAFLGGSIDDAEMGRERKAATQIISNRRVGEILENWDVGGGRKHFLFS